MDDRIEQQIVISAPVYTVWDLVSNPGWWVPTASEQPPDRTPGHQTVRESEKWGRFPVEVVEMRPQDYCAFRWASHVPGAELTGSNTTLVEFFLADGGDKVTVTVVESGFAALDAPDEARQAAVKGNASGWSQMMAELRDRAQAPGA